MEEIKHLCEKWQEEEVSIHAVYAGRLEISEGAGDLMKSAQLV